MCVYLHTEFEISSIILNFKIFWFPFILEKKNSYAVKAVLMITLLQWPPVFNNHVVVFP